MLLGLYDMRRDSPTFGKSTLITLSPELQKAAYIPTGVAHGFYFTKPSTTMYGLSEYWSMKDEYGCHPEDVNLNISWPEGAIILFERDSSAGGLEALQADYDKWKIQNNG